MGQLMNGDSPKILHFCNGFDDVRIGDTQNPDQSEKKQ